MPAVEEKGKVLNQLLGEDRRGLEGAWAHLGRATELFCIIGSVSFLKKLLLFY